jgi:hypothetical protein
MAIHVTDAQGLRSSLPKQDLGPGALGFVMCDQSPPFGLTRSTNT